MSMTQYSQITRNDYSQIRKSEWSHQSEAPESHQLQTAADTDLHLLLLIPYSLLL